MSALHSETRRQGEPFVEAFVSIARYLGRPTSQTVLFSGIPFDEHNPLPEDIEALAERLGLEVRRYDRNDLVRGEVELPALVLFKDGTATAILEPLGDADTKQANVDFRSMSEVVKRNSLLQRDIRHILSFTVTYLNRSEDPSYGLAARIERKHWLLGAVSPYWRSYGQVVLAALFINMLALASPLFVMNVYDRILPNEAITSLWVLAVGVGLAMLFDLLLKWVRASLIDYAGRRADLKLSYMLFQKALNSSLSARPASTGEYAGRLTQYEFVRDFFTSNTISVVIDSLFAFVFILLIFFISGWLVVFPIAAFVLTVVIGLVAQMRIARHIAAASNEAAQRQGLLVEALATIETVKSLRAEVTLLRKWRELAKKASHTSERIKQLSSNATNLTQFVQQLVTVFIVVGGAYSFAEGTMSTGAIIASVMLSNRAVAPLGQITMTLARFRQAVLSLRILDSIMAQPEDVPDTVGFVNRPITQGRLAFKDVAFAYPGTDYKVLTGLSFAARAGERIGIIGRIGSGKTTIGRLLGGLYYPTAGTLAIDGIDIRQYHSAEVRSAVAVASQNADLFSGTIKENLLLGRADASDEDLIRVSKLTGLDELVSRHPRGYDMAVGERGSNLSGGQRQAVAIARLLLSNPKVVFLDEPSGSMDLTSERQLISNLSKAFGPEVTLIISTHRYSMLELVDRLIVIDQGRVIADGPKKEVIQELQRRSAAGD